MEQYSEFYQALRSYLNVDPAAAERFFLKEIDLSIDLLTYHDIPYKKAHSIITNGLSRHAGGVGCELVFSFEPESVFEDVDFNAFVVTYVQLCYLKKDGVYPGGFYNAGVDILKGYSFKGIYVTNPVYFLDDLILKDSSINTLWVIPIYESECNFIDVNGGYEFGVLLEKLDPDLTRLDRLPVV